MQAVPGRTRDSKTEIFLFYSKCCVSFLLVSLWYLRGYLEWLIWNHHWHSGHYLIAKGFQRRNICVRYFAYVKIFSALFILARTKPIYFSAIVTVHAFNKFHVLHAVDQMLLYAEMPIKRLKTVSVWINITLKVGEGKVLFILKIFRSLLIQRAENISSQNMATNHLAELEVYLVILIS